MMYHDWWNNNMRLREYPEVDAQLFHQSALAFKQLMSDATVLTNALVEDQTLTRNMMSAAQANDRDQVKQLIHTTGVKEDVDVAFNPDSISFNMSSKASGVDCCRLNMKIRWQ